MMNTNDPDSINPDLRPRTTFLSGNWREIVATVIAIAAFFFAGKVMQSLAPSAGTTDFGAIDIMLFAVTAALCAHLGVWVIFRVAMKTFHRYLDDKGFRRDFIELRKDHRVWTTLAVIFFELWLLVTLASIVAGQKP
jgi:hypothetical protein